MHQVKYPSINHQPSATGIRQTTNIKGMKCRDIERALMSMMLLLLYKKKNIVKLHFWTYY